MGSKLRPSDKPSTFQYGPCPICIKNGYDGSHFKYFHDEVVKKLRSKRRQDQPEVGEGKKGKGGKKPKNPKSRINATTNATKDNKPEKNPSKDPKKKEEPVARKDLLALGDSIKEASRRCAKSLV